MAKLIWVIDDSITVRKILGTCLPREGFEVQVFCDGIEALLHLKTRQGVRVPDLIIVDIGLPKMDGYDLLQELKARAALSETVLLAISVRDGVTDRLKARLAGAADYICKPFTIEDVVTLLRQLLNLPVEEPQIPRVPRAPHGAPRLRAFPGA
jgi:twitching motility two-component system response regulator PilG